MQFLRFLHPGRNLAGLHRRQGQRQAHGQGRSIRLAHELVQGQLFDLQVIATGNFLGNHQVKAGLRLACVGDGGGADFKIPLGGRQLLRNSCLLRQHKGQAVLRRQHIKITGAHFNNQILFSGQQLLFNHRDLPPALVKGDLVDGTIERPGGAQGGTLGVVKTLLGLGQGVVDGAQRRIRTHADGVQQAGARLL